MKSSRVMSLAIIAMLVVSVLAGYFGSTFGGKAAAGTSSGAASAATDASNGSWLDNVKKRGELRVGVAAFPPIVEQTSNGTWTGPMLDPLRELAAALGVKLVPVGTTWQDIIAGLQAGKYDIAAGTDVTLQRSLAVQFTQPYYIDHGVFVVKRNSPYSTSAQILQAHKALAEAQGSAHDAAVTAAGAPTLNLDNWPDALQALKDGRAIAEFTDSGTAESQVENDKSLAIVRANPELWLSSVGFVVPLGIDQQSLQTINVAILMAQSSGEQVRNFAKVGYVGIDQLGSLAK